MARYVLLQGSEHVSSARARLEVLMNRTDVSELKKETYGPFFENLINDRETVAAAIVELKFFDSLAMCVESSRCSKSSLASTSFLMRKVSCKTSDHFC
ncbi:hypothetical protein [Bradyrhizobium jicamae]|uniref:hypothetical protein n=1 Tax=Bradyrhizobium jicamae TaxID=280332 RepID=UPI0012ED8D0A|nr:hypothetical protein [Bradyrhizobium jicamae]